MKSSTFLNSLLNPLSKFSLNFSLSIFVIVISVLLGQKILAISLAIPVLSQQTTTNSINLQIIKVTKDNQTLNTKSLGDNKWSFDQPLGDKDEIRYGWRDVYLDTSYKNKKISNAGYIKLYKNDDSSEDNFIKDIGSSPLKIDSIKDSLEVGNNQLLFVYIDSSRPESIDTKVLFNFVYQEGVFFGSGPFIEVLEPAKGQIFVPGVDKDFKLRVKNFELVENFSEDLNSGKIKVYFNKPIEENFLGVIDASDKQEEDGEVFVSFNNQDFQFDKIPDSQDTKIIFEMVAGEKETKVGQASQISVKTNYGSSIDLGLPSIKFINPKSNNSVISITRDTKFVFDINNFEIFKNDDNDVQNEADKGYVEIRIDDGLINNPKDFEDRSFSLNSLSVPLDDNLDHQISIELINKNSTRLEPPTKDTLRIKVEKDLKDKPDTRVEVESNNWRLVIIGITIILVVGGISVLITKG
jgi:hypothetical protein